ncbi:MAG TPA: hypothetical protein VFC24_10380 [Casimicrobiaceae bacterium]|nr:hypothetical protein [Casimicrobiaceae bacterium]
MSLSEEPAERMARSIALRLYKLGNQPKSRLTPDPHVPWLDRSYFQRAGDELKRRGFRDLGCYRIEAGRGEAADGLRYRLLVSADGATRAAVAVVRARVAHVGWVTRALAFLLGRMPRARRVIELATTLSNGAVITTSNSGQANPFSAPADYDTARLPEDTPLEAQLASHRGRTEKQLARDRSARIERVTDLASYERLREIEREHRNRHRQSIGYVSDEELRALTKEHYAQLRASILYELQRLRTPEAPRN